MVEGSLCVLMYQVTNVCRQFTLNINQGQKCRTNVPIEYKILKYTEPCKGTLDSCPKAQHAALKQKEKNRRKQSKIAELHIAHQQFSNVHGALTVQCNTITISKQQQKNAHRSGKLQTQPFHQKKIPFSLYVFKATQF